MPCAMRTATAPLGSLLWLEMVRPGEQREELEVPGSCIVPVLPCRSEAWGAEGVLEVGGSCIFLVPSLQE